MAQSLAEYWSRSLAQFGQLQSQSTAGDITASNARRDARQRAGNDERAERAEQGTARSELVALLNRGAETTRVASLAERDPWSTLDLLLESEAVASAERLFELGNLSRYGSLIESWLRRILHRHAESDNVDRISSFLEELCRSRRALWTTSQRTVLLEPSRSVVALAAEPRVSMLWVRLAHLSLAAAEREHAQHGADLPRGEALDRVLRVLVGAVDGRQSDDHGVRTDAAYALGCAARCSEIHALRAEMKGGGVPSRFYLGGELRRRGSLTAEGLLGSECGRSALCTSIALMWCAATDACDVHELVSGKPHPSTAGPAEGGRTPSAGELTWPAGPGAWLASLAYILPLCTASEHRALSRGLLSPLFGGPRYAVHAELRAFAALVRRPALCESLYGSVPSDSADLARVTRHICHEMGETVEREPVETCGAVLGDIYRLALSPLLAQGTSQASVDMFTTAVLSLSGGPLGSTSERALQELRTARESAELPVWYAESIERLLVQRMGAS